MKRYNEIIVHYTATYEDDTSITVARIDKMHRERTPPFAKIGYHFVIYQDGTVHVGRPLTETGAHAPPNTGRIGVCYVGGLRRGDPKNGYDTRTPAQTASMTQLIHALLAGHYNSLKVGAEVFVDPHSEVKGHKDVGNTQCPGFDAGAWWRGVVTGKPQPSKPATPSAPVRTENLGVDPLRRPGPTQGPWATLIAWLFGLPRN